MPGSLAEFVRDLSEQGRVQVLAGGPAGAPDEALAAAIAACDAAARLDAPGRPPTLDLAVARWAFALLYDACRLLVHRELGAEVVARVFAVACPAEPSPATAWSADLALRHLPALLALAAGLADGDPLVAALRDCARRWPLSSVGIGGLGALAAGVVGSDPSLLGLYVDRVIAAGDRDRLGDPLVAELARAALGAHAGLRPGFLEVA